jgi:hypothetical protein
MAGEEVPAGFDAVIARHRGRSCTQPNGVPRRADRRVAQMARGNLRVATRRLGLGGDECGVAPVLHTCAIVDSSNRRCEGVAE